MTRQFLEDLENRSYLASGVTVSFNSVTGVLTIIGDSQDNDIVVSRDGSGAIRVDASSEKNNGNSKKDKKGKKDRINQTAATVANTALIVISTDGGDDSVEFDEANGSLPAAQMFLGAGNDTAIGGFGADQIFGQAGNDELSGRLGNDFLFGGTENDHLTGSDGDDEAFGEAGDDRMIWNPGDDTDINEGGDGNDTTEVNGGNGAEVFAATANGTRVRFDRVNPAPFVIDIGTTENLVLNSNGGDDNFSATGNLATLISLTVDGGAGNDTELGGNGADLLIGGDGDDSIDGNQGNDIASLGASDDVFQWDPGDGSDVVEGGAGTDTMLFNGANIAENFDLAANGSRFRFTRNIGNITMDLDDVEHVDLPARGGADNVTIHDLTGTDVTQVNVDLGATGGGGDGSADNITAEGTGNADTFSVTGAGTSYAIIGLPAVVQITNSEGANDILVLNTLGGEDALGAASLQAGVVKLTLNGGADDDQIFGSQGSDVLIGEDGDDFILGDNGDDVAFMGAGNDTFQWDPGDGSDIIEGQADFDTMLFKGANVAENVDISANGNRVLFTRNVANVVMDLDDTEKVVFKALGGADNIVVGDLTGTDLTDIDLFVSGNGGGGDGAPDSIVINGTSGDDTITIASNSNLTSVTGLPAQVNVIDLEAANDTLTINGQMGKDTINASGLEADVVKFVANGGLGDDTFLGRAGDDLVTGGDGADLALLGDGNDTFVWNPGDDNDIVEGQGGTDTMLFNGANIAEIIAISPNGGRVLFTRNVANVVMDLDDVEAIDFNVLGGADAITVNDMTGTDLSEVNVSLASTIGGNTGDGAADSVIVNGTNGSDTIIVAGDANGVSVLGLQARTNITGAEAANDRLTVQAVQGPDTVNASGLAVGAIAFTGDGGQGDDVVIGGAGDDILLGGDGDDVLVGGPGVDVLDGGTGSNTLIP